MLNGIVRCDDDIEIVSQSHRVEILCQLNLRFGRNDAKMNAASTQGLQQRHNSVKNRDFLQKLRKFRVPFPQHLIWVIQLKADQRILAGNAQSKPKLLQ